MGIRGPKVLLNKTKSLKNWQVSAEQFRVALRVSIRTCAKNSYWIYTTVIKSDHEGVNMIQSMPKEPL